MVAEIETTVKDVYGRFKDAPWFAQGPQEIIIGGAGGIGSWVALALARASHILHIYDMDDYDLSNVAGQFVSLSAIGKNKAEALKQQLSAFCDEPDISTYGRFDEEGGMATPIMISAFDNMNARKLMFEKWSSLEDREIFIDGRQGPEHGTIFAVLKGQESQYKESLFDDGEVEDLECSYKATTHCGMRTASEMVAQLNNYLSNKYFGKLEGTDYSDIRQVNFRIDFNLSSNDS